MGVDIRVRVKGGGQVSQIYGECFTNTGKGCTNAYAFLLAIRQAISKSLVAYYQKCKSCVSVHSVLYLCSCVPIWLILYQ